MSEMSPEPGEEVSLLFDPGNPFAPAMALPATVTFGRQNANDGTPLLVVTIRSGLATLTLKQQRDEAIQFAGLWRQHAKDIPALHVPVGGLIVPNQGPNGHPH